MNIISIRSQLEDELTWRSSELKLLENQLSFVSNDEDKRRYRKALVVMLYSHFEGFCKACFLIYVKAINDELLLRSQANIRLVVASLAREFGDLENTNRKTQLTKDISADDERLHRYGRQVEFIEKIDNLWAQTARIPEDIVDTEANLKPRVLEKILYRLGFDHHAFQDYYGTIHKLLRYRNDIAHGAKVDGVDEQEYNSLRSGIQTIMTKIIDVIFDTLVKRKYLRSDLHRDDETASVTVDNDPATPSDSVAQKCSRSSSLNVPSDDGFKVSLV
ncbi:MAE_28990/MAE_18760 family HEPN-like nuclease [Alicyclobacillus macrosporangiidus]|uniref:RiboL-PSP-HEPN domain-containing protein n=1 Tax=Alicyclobacillus macrosporangiidus TaxID=392015 RepID=A0A1I7KSA1_9BACL|nr:MAE_28990/MAE_18760 family HEPN-like nuclease [Alicyclobacillus macrosporangiidus]SFV00285.1 hypothetical protein SAMN05421543_11881 [Alicyclobacillus macrosporangiidus]